MPDKSRMAAAFDQQKPSASTVATGAGGAISVVVLWIIEASTGLTVPAHVAASIATLAGLAAGYFFSGGRSADTK